MKTILHETLNGMRHITAQYNPEIKSVSLRKILCYTMVGNFMSVVSH